MNISRDASQSFLDGWGVGVCSTTLLVTSMVKMKGFRGPSPANGGLRLSPNAVLFGHYAELVFIKQNLTLF